MKPGPALVAEIIFSSLSLDAPPKSLEDVLHGIMDEHPSGGI